MVLSILVMSVVAFADGTSCNVRGATGQVTLKRENAQSGANSQVCVELSTSTEKPVQVIVKCFDAATDQCVGVKSIKVEPVLGAWACFDVKKDHPYYFRISDAHCG